MRISVTFGFLSLILASCAGTDLRKSSAEVDLNAFTELTERTFETPTSDTKNIIKDRRVRIYSDALPGVWLYSQMNTGKTHKLYRQRVSQLSLSDDGTSIIQTSYGLNAPESFVDAWDNPSVFQALTPESMKPYFSKGCEQVWRLKTDNAWKGYVNPETCVITSKRRNTEIRIESESYLSETEYRTNERGYDINMNFLWGSQPGEMITLYPVD